MLSNCFEIKISNAYGVISWSIDFSSEPNDTDTTYIISVISELQKALRKLTPKSE